jgi:O-antigen ligase
MLLRDFAKYNIVLALWAVGLLYYYSRSAETVLAAVRRCRPAVGLFVYVSVYYVFSLLFTREYSINLPMVEVVFVVAGILVLGRRRALLSAALQGFIVCACAVGIAMMPYIESSGRLGMVYIEGYRLGNPSQLGGSLALGLLALALDRGRWLHLERRPIVLFGSMAVTIAILYLTTSRGSWLVVAAGSLVAWLVGRGQRIRLLLVVAMFAVTLPTLLLTRYGPGVQLGLERTLGEDQSLRKRTSGRSDQWVVAYSAFTSSLGSVVYGHGPGMGRAVYAAESLTVPGVDYAVGREEVFHSLFMQVAVEAGVLGLAPLVVWLALILYRAINWVLRYREVFPLAAGVGYLCIGATVGAQGTIAGVFVGVALLASVRSLTPDGAIRGRSARRRRDSGHVDTETTA